MGAAGVTAGFDVELSINLDRDHGSETISAEAYRTSLHPRGCHLIFGPSDCGVILYAREAETIRDFLLSLVDTLDDAFPEVAAKCRS